MDYEAYYREFGERVRSARSPGTQSDLARASGMTRAAIANIETGRNRVTLDVLDRLAQALAVAPATLLPIGPADIADEAGPPLARRDRAALDRVLAAAGIRSGDDAAG